MTLNVNCFLYSRLCFCAENAEYFVVDKRESTRLYLHLVAQNASFRKTKTCAEEF